MLHTVEGCQTGVAHPQITKTFQGYLENMQNDVRYPSYTWKVKSDKTHISRDFNLRMISSWILMRTE